MGATPGGSGDGERRTRYVEETVQRLYPNYGSGIPLMGLYLGHDLRERAQASSEPYVYANFITSLDGRISIPDPHSSGQVVPEQTANPRDWRLFQELAVQADVLITTGRYLRDYAEGKAQEILRVYEDSDFADLRDWRANRGLQPFPALAVISGSLNFPIPEPLTLGNRDVIVATTEQANHERARAIESQLGKVAVLGQRGVDGRMLVETLSGMGYQTIYSTAGPKVLHLLLTAGALDRLYLTVAGRILGGTAYSSIVEGPLLDPPIDFQLYELLYDPNGPDGLGQMFASYDHVESN